MSDYELFPDEDQERVIEIAQDFLPDHADLALLSFTGGRKFGWGGEHHDIDVHGFFASETWFNKCHSMHEGYDMTITNIHSLEDPDIKWESWKKYYDKSNPIFIHDDFDYEGFMDSCKPEYVTHVFPYDIQLQISRMENQFHARAALHTYKELLIPVHYLTHGEIESNVVRLNEEYYDYEGLSDCTERYKTRKPIEIDEAKIKSEIDELFHWLAREIREKNL